MYTTLQADQGATTEIKRDNFSRMRMHLRHHQGFKCAATCYQDANPRMTGRSYLDQLVGACQLYRALIAQPFSLIAARQGKGVDGWIGKTFVLLFD